MIKQPSFKGLADIAVCSIRDQNGGLRFLYDQQIIDQRKSYTSSYLCYKAYFKRQISYLSDVKNIQLFYLHESGLRHQLFFPIQTIKAISPDFRTPYKLMINGRLKNISFYQTCLRENFLLVVNILLLHSP
jgi:hypothetical protein